MDASMIVLLVLFLVFSLPIIIIVLTMQHKKEMAKLNNQMSDSAKQHYDEELTHVKKRLAILEAIVTDKKYQLNEEISALKVVDK